MFINPGNAQAGAYGVRYLMEFEPCDALKPYVRCFWGTWQPIEQLKKDAFI